LAALPIAIVTKTAPLPGTFRVGMAEE